MAGMYDRIVGDNPDIEPINLHAAYAALREYHRGALTKEQLETIGKVGEEDQADFDAIVAAVDAGGLTVVDLTEDVSVLVQFGYYDEQKFRERLGL